jgi:hypothetical protein
MKNTATTRIFLGFQNLFIAIIVILLYSCAGKEASMHAPVEAGYEIEYGEAYDTVLPSQGMNPLKLEDYKVILAVDEMLRMNETGEMRVWIGATDINPEFSLNKGIDSTIIPASIGQYAKITPYAPDFEVSPSTMECIRIDPSGSDVRFSIKPKKPGTLKVSANIELYNNADCSGTPVPKTAATLTVNVKVDIKQVIVHKLKEMGVVFWDKFMSFWGALITLIFGALIFLIKRILKRKTGFNNKNG